MNSPLTLIPAKVRLGVYLTYFLLTLAFSSVGAYFLALHERVPDWAIGGAAAIVPIGAAFAAVAASNTFQPTPAVQNVYEATPVEPTPPAATPTADPSAGIPPTEPVSAEPSLP